LYVNMDGVGEFDWRQHHKSLGEQLWYMYQFEIETDLEINLYDEQIRKVLPQKILLQIIPSIKDASSAIRSDGQREN
jgi:hypothetical protein